MPTERPRQANLYWLVGGAALLLLVVWRPASGAALVVGLTVAALALALAHDYWAVVLPGWHRAQRAGLLLGCGVLGVAAFLAWPLAPLVPCAAVLLATIVLQSQRGRWPNAVDRLTGLPTAAAFALRGDEELSRGLRFGRPATVAVIRIVNANDILALHDRNSFDQALRRIADILRQHSRGYDLLGRLDDTRFAILLPETNQDDATAITDRISAAIEQFQGGAPIRLVASAGLAAHPWGGDSVRELIEHADARSSCCAHTAEDPHAHSGHRAHAPGRSGNAAPPAATQSPHGAAIATSTPIAVRLFNAPAWSVPAYIALIWLVVALLFAATFALVPQPDWPPYITLLIVSVIARNSRIPLYGRGAISFQFVPLIAASILFEPTFVFILAACSTALLYWTPNFRWQAYIFDIGQNVLTTGILALCAPLLGRTLPTPLPFHLDLILQGLTLGALCYLLNGALLITVMSLHEGANPLKIWRERVRWFLPYTLVFGLLAVFVAWSSRAYGPLGIVIFTIPAFMVHLVTKQYVDRTKVHVTALREAHDRLAVLNRDLQSSVEAVERSYSATLSAFSGMLDARDSETEGHSQRVVAYAVAIGQALNLSQRDLAALEVGALLHDIGKVGVPDAILRKPGKLTELEWEEMRRHPEIGYQLTSRIPFLDAASPLVRHHHERWDGTGYPLGLRGEDIPLAARIFAVADAYDALVSDRPYRPGRSHQQAIEEIRRYAGTQFDPHIVTTFLQVTASADWSDQAIRQSGNTIPVSQLVTL